MKKYIIAGVVLVFLAAGYIIFASRTPKVAADCAMGSQNTTITYTPARAFSPACVKITSGATITWINNSSRTLQVGANPHPIHTGNREVSNGKFVLEVAPNQTAQTVMTTKGTFGYHDHLHPFATGVIVVQ